MVPLSREKELSQVTGGLAFFILLPIFFSFESGLFMDPVMVFDSGGSLVRLPIPISVAACFVGMLRSGRIRRAALSLGSVLASAVLMAMAVWVAGTGGSQGFRPKLLLLLQFLLPMSALVLGQQRGGGKEDVSSLCNAFLLVIVIIVPAQIIVTWMQGTFYLYPKIYFFSIYQHLQYASVIFVSAYVLALHGLWPSQNLRRLLVILFPIMGVYATVSNSISALLLLFLGGISMAVVSYRQGGSRALALAVIAAAALAGGYRYCGININGSVQYACTGHALPQQSALPEPGLTCVGDAPRDPAIGTGVYPNVSARVHYWKTYIKASTSSVRAFLFGGVHRVDRERIPSAHNYYLDFVYHFGAIALLPILSLMGFTIVRLHRASSLLMKSPVLLCLAFVVMFLVLFDNFLKVGLRQPYPGLFTFFLWGLLLSRLEEGPA